MYHYQLMLISGMQSWFSLWKSRDVTLHINKLKRETYYSFNSGRKQSLTQSNIHPRKTQQTKSRGDLLNLINGISENPQASHLMVKDSMCHPIRNQVKCQALTISIQHTLGVLHSARERTDKMHQIPKAKLTLSSDDSLCSSTL